MDIRAIDCFVTVARSGSVTAAANALFMSQPGVSKQISRLERLLGVDLFHRTPTGMVLTPAGSALLELGSDVLTRIRRAEALLRSRYGGAPAFVVACPHSTADAVIMPFIAESAPPIIDLRVVDAPDVDHALDHDADLGIGTIRPPAHRASLRVADVPVTVQAPGEQFDRDQTRVDLESLHDRWLIVPRTGVRTAVLGATSGFDEALLVRDSATGALAQALAVNGHGLALATEPARFDLRAVPAYVGGRPLTIELYASWEARHYASTDLHAVAASLRRWLAERRPWTWTRDAPAPRSKDCSRG